MKICGVYKITSPSGKIYIGSSKNVKERWNSYYKLSCKKQIKLYNSFLKYGVKNHVFEIIEECLLNDLLNWEYLWIKEYNSCNKNGLNCKSPKFGDLKAIVSEETRKKMSENAINRKFSNETRRRMSISQSNRYKNIEEKEKTSIAMKKVIHKPVSEETKQKLRIANLGKKQSIETINKRRKYLKNRILTEDHRLKLSKSSSTSKLTINLETGIFFDQIKEAAKAYNIKPSLLQSGLRKKSKKYEKFKIC
jgi:group I intron endonuclease